jgi:hypothetical protein
MDDLDSVLARLQKRQRQVKWTLSVVYHASVIGGGWMLSGKWPGALLVAFAFVAIDMVFTAVLWRVERASLLRSLREHPGRAALLARLVIEIGRQVTLLPFQLLFSGALQLVVVIGIANARWVSPETLSSLAFWTAGFFAARVFRDRVRADLENARRALSSAPEAEHGQTPGFPHAPTGASP